MSERISDEDLTAMLDKSALERDGGKRRRTFELIHNGLSELRERRSADLTDEDRELLESFRRTVTIWVRGEALKECEALFDKLLNGAK